MPRQVDSSLLQAQVNNDPNNTISSGGVSNILNNGRSGIPSITPQFILNAIMNLLSEIASATGIDLSSPTAFFTSLVTMILNGGSEITSFIGAVLQPLIDALVSLLGGIPIIGGAIDTLANFLGLTHTTANTGVTNAATAQSTAESALALASQTAAQIAAGSNMSYTDGFGRAIDPSAGTDLGADYSRDADSGSGTWATDGMGDAHATSSGATAQEFRDRNTVAVFATDKQAGSVVISTVPQAAGGFGTTSCRIGISLREDSAGTTKVVAYYDSGVVEIGYYLSGTYTQLGTQPVTQANGDLFEFHAGADPGSGYNDYNFEVLINNHVVYGVSDTGALSSKGVGSGFKYGGLIARLGNVVTGFFFTIQTACPDVQILNLFDRT
jgi:hypothetical protein